MRIYGIDVRSSEKFPHADFARLLNREIKVQLIELLLFRGERLVEAVNVALANASPAQRRILDDCYGRKDPVKEAMVKEVYAELDLKGKYEAYEKASYEKVTGLIAQLPKDEPLKPEVFTSFLNKIYKRTK